MIQLREQYIIIVLHVRIPPILYIHWQLMYQCHSGGFDTMRMRKYWHVRTIHYNHTRGTGKCESYKLQKWVAIGRETEPALREFDTVNVGIGSELGLNSGTKKSDNYAAMVKKMLNS